MIRRSRRPLPARCVLALLVALAAACAGERADTESERIAAEARRTYAHKLDLEYRKDGGEVTTSGRGAETIELRVPETNATWCETFPTEQSRNLLRDLGFRTVVLRNEEREVCRVALGS